MGITIFTNPNELVKQARERHQKLINHGVMPDKVTAEIRWLNKAYKKILTHDKEVCEKSRGKMDLGDELDLVGNGFNFGVCDIYYITAMLDRYLCYNYIALRDIKNMNAKSPAVPAVVDMTNYFKFQYETKAYLALVKAYLQGLSNELHHSCIKVSDGKITKTRFVDHNPPKFAFKIDKMLKPLNKVDLSDDMLMDIYDKVSYAFRHAKCDMFDEKDAFASYKKDNLDILDAFSFRPLEEKPQHRFA